MWRIASQERRSVETALSEVRVGGSSRRSEIATLARGGAQCRKTAVNAEDLPRNPTVLFLQQPCDH